MSLIRELSNPLILDLLKLHDELPNEEIDQRKLIQRRIIFLMTTIKLYELEEAYGLETPHFNTLKHRQQLQVSQDAASIY